MRYSKKQMLKAWFSGVIHERETKTGLPGISFEEWIAIQREETCAWVGLMPFIADGHLHYITNCGGFRVHKDGDFCPLCSKRIVIAGGALKVEGPQDTSIV